MFKRGFILAGLILISLTIVTGCSSGGGSTSNDLDLDTKVCTNGNGFVAVARGKIFSGKGSIHIDTSSATGDGGNVILVAGATSVKAAQSTTITGHFPAHSHPFPVGMAGLHRHADEPQDGRVHRIVKVSYRLIDPIHRQGVLDKVVGANGQEVQFLDQEVGHDGRRGDLDHGPYFQLVTEHFPFLAQFFLAFQKQWPWFAAPHPGWKSWGTSS